MRLALGRWWGRVVVALGALRLEGRTDLPALAARYARDARYWRERCGLAERQRDRLEGEARDGREKRLLLEEALRQAQDLGRTYCEGWERERAENEHLRRAVRRRAGTVPGGGDGTN